MRGNFIGVIPEPFQFRDNVSVAVIDVYGGFGVVGYHCSVAVIHGYAQRVERGSVGEKLYELHRVLQVSALAVCLNDGAVYVYQAVSEILL